MSVLPWPPRGEPRDIGRFWRRESVGLPLGLTLVGAFWLGLELLSGSVAVQARWVLGVGLALGVPLCILMLRRRRWWECHLRAHDGRVCPHCAHGLSGLADKAQCPECGRWHDIERLRAEWFAAFKLDVPPPPSEPRSDAPRGGGGNP